MHINTALPVSFLMSAIRHLTVQDSRYKNGEITGYDLPWQADSGSAAMGDHDCGGVFLGS